MVRILGGASGTTMGASGKAKTTLFWPIVLLVFCCVLFSSIYCFEDLDCQRVCLGRYRVRQGKITLSLLLLLLLQGI